MAKTHTTITDGYFSGLKQAKNLTQYKLYKGVTDWGKVEQFNLYESGYGFLYVLDIPRYMRKLAEKSEDMANLVNNYVHCIEYEFKSIDGFNEITVDTLDINNGIEEIKVIGKVNRQAFTEFTMTYTEKTGSVFTRFHEIFLKGIKDTSTQAKSYYGMVGNGEMEDGYENEIFTFLYINTDNTMLRVEKAYLFLACQPINADVGIYEVTKGDINIREVQLRYHGYMAEGKEIYQKAKQVLDHQNRNIEDGGIVLNSEAFHYTGIDAIKGKDGTSFI